jgi:type IV secretory pathway TraG/TraD family ATPase VirD4
VAIFIGSGVMITAAVWTVVGSAILCKMAGRMEAFVFPWDQWWEYAFSWYGANWWATACVIISGVLAAVPALAIGALVIAWMTRRRPGAGVYGKTGWANQKQMQAGGLSTDRKPF